LIDPETHVSFTPVIEWMGEGAVQRDVAVPSAETVMESATGIIVSPDESRRIVRAVVKRGREHIVNKRNTTRKQRCHMMKKMMKGSGDVWGARAN